MNTGVISVRYARALLKTACEQGLEDNICTPRFAIYGSLFMTSLLLRHSLRGYSLPVVFSADLAFALLCQQ